MILNGDDLLDDGELNALMHRVRAEADEGQYYQRVPRIPITTCEDILSALRELQALRQSRAEDDAVIVAHLEQVEVGLGSVGYDLEGAVAELDTLRNKVDAALKAMGA